MVENKIDLIKEIGLSPLAQKLINSSDEIPYDSICSISTFDTDSIENLKNILIDKVNCISTNGDTVVSNARHFEALQNASKSISNIISGLETELSGDLLTVHINKAMKFLGEISGEITNDELLGNIFSKFCIGK